MSLASPTICTAEGFLESEDLQGPVELVKGRVIQSPPPLPRHAQLCAKLACLFGNFADAQFGHVLSNVCLITQRNPDTIRNADVAYVSYKTIPKGPMPVGYLSVPVDLVIKVSSPSDRWKDLTRIVLEYLESGVTAVCVVDPMTETVRRVYRWDHDERQFCIGDTLTFEDILPGFALPLKQLFE